MKYRLFPLYLSVTIAAPAFAHISVMEEVMVVGQKPRAVGDRTSASEGLIVQSDLDVLPSERTGDMLELVPGLVATQHSGSGKANQYFLRGFNLDHGTDFSTRVDYMPVNMVSHGHGQGYTDLNFLIPELVDSIRYRKGPFYADTGDFSGTGDAHFQSARFLDGNLLKLEVGGLGYRRALFAGQWETGPGVWLTGVEWQGYDGPWTNVDEDVSKSNVWLKYTSGGDLDGLDITLMAYRNRWYAADQIPWRAVAAGDISEYATVDPSSGGESSRFSLSVQKRWHTDQAFWFTNAYVIRYEMDLWSNFTYFTLPQGDQIRQRDERLIAGGDLAHTRDFTLAAVAGSQTFGLQLRADRIDPVGLYSSVMREQTGVTREDKVAQQMAAAYWQAALQWSPRFTTTFNARWNQHRFDVEALDAADRSTLVANSGSQSDGLLTGALRNRWFVNSTSDLYFNIGRSYHSNDARGVMSTQDVNGSGAIEPADPLVPVDGVELGGNWQSMTGVLASSFALWAAQIESELLFVGDAGTTENTGVKSERHGLEVTATWQPSQGWLLNADYAWTHTRLDDASLQDQAIPGALKNTLDVSAVRLWSQAWQSALRVRRFGSYHLGDGVYADSATRLDLNTRYVSRGGLTVSLDVLNLLDSDDRDIEYWYASQLQNEVTPQDDRHLHVFAPRSLRLKLGYEF